MKYYQSSKFPKFVGSTGFYVIIACCLVAIGAASWFAISRYNNITNTPSNISKSSSVFSEPSSSYNSSSGINSSSSVDSASVAQTVSDEPYSSEDVETKPSFTIPVKGNITKGFSDTALQYSTTYKDMRLHTGIDIACEKGQEIKSAGAGTVTAVEDSDKLGKVVTINHGNGILVKYCGLKDVKAAVNDKVAMGEVIAVLGDIPSECDDPSHLHLEVTKDGKPVSPLAALGLE